MSPKKTFTLKNEKLGIQFLFFFLFPILSSGLSSAQTQETTIEIHAHSRPTALEDLKKNITTETTLARKLESAETIANSEENLIKALRSKVPTSCAEKELNLREAYLNFFRKNEKQINSLINTIRSGLKLQRSILEGYEQGIVEGAPLEIFNFNGQSDRSAIIAFEDLNSKGTLSRVEVPVKNLIRFVEKFEEEAKLLSDSPQEIHDFLKRYQSNLNLNDPNYFYLNLARAAKAYSGCEKQGCLNSVFKSSLNSSGFAVIASELFTGQGKQQFRILTSTELGFDPTYQTRFGSLLKPSDKLSPGASKNVTITLAQNFSEAFTQAKEDRYWEIIRKQQLTINQIPIDGYLRRLYFDRLRTPECSKPVYIFNPKTAPGPYQDYADKEVCKRVGFEILTATVTPTNGPKKDTVFQITSELQTEAGGKKGLASKNGFYDLVQNSGVGQCDDATFNLSYRCGCSPEIHRVSKHYKFGNSLSFTCDE